MPSLVITRAGIEMESDVSCDVMEAAHVKLRNLDTAGSGSGSTCQPSVVYCVLFFRVSHESRDPRPHRQDWQGVGAVRWRLNNR